MPQRLPTNRRRDELGDRKLILAGQITAAHGLKGEVKLRSFTDDPFAIARYGPLEDGGGRALTIVKLRAAKGGLVASLAGVEGRSAAEALRGRKLFIDRQRLPEPAAGTCYQADLIGLEVRTAGGRVLGRVVEIVNYGAGDLLEVEIEAAAQSLLVPLIGAIVDLAARTITVELPDGFLDEE
jgi:16S rRNA processing protein RimM